MTGSDILQAKIATWAKEQGDKPWIIETSTGDTLNYQDIPQAVFALKDYFGSQPKTIVIALSGGILEAVVWLASLTGGHLLVPISPHLTSFEYDEIVRQHTPDIIIAEKRENFLKDSHNLVTLAQLREILVTRKEKVPSTQAREGRIYLSTSGSTGKPKGILLSATQIVLTAENIRKSHNLTAADRGLTPLPFYHVNAPVVSLITSILSGSTLIIAPKYSTTHFWEWVKTYDPTWISLVPAMIAMLLSTERPEFLDHASLRFIRTASAPLPVENLKRFEEKFGIPLIETYGITEAASTIVANPPPPGKHKPGSAGLPLGIQARVCSLKSNKVLPQGETGEICIKGPNVITAYEGNVSPESFAEGWFRTGDLGYIDTEGYVYLTGRIKDIIIRGGENISPREIEEVLFTFPSVKEAVVVGQPHPIYGEQVVAFVVMRGEGNGEIAQKIKEYTREKLSPQKVPEKIFILNDLPRGRTGKIDKQLLKNSWENGISQISMR